MNARSGQRAVPAAHINERRGR